ncbi:MAG TPA: alpha/beta hydrolase [Chthoniobacterales bacterium]|jgi:predicted esterase|nr:alpha/beta hydrolase [Chthoniobacterales bacterium]
MTPELDFVHEFVPGSSERTLLLLHGTGGDEKELVPLGRELDPAAGLLSPRGPVLENGHARFFRRLAEGVFDLEDLKRRTDDLAEFIIAAAQRYGFDAAKLVAVGYSNGANVAASVFLRRPGVLRTAILLRAMVPFMPEELPDLRGVQVWIAGGKLDMVIPRANTERLAEMLSSAGAEVSARFFEAGHGLTNTELVLAKRWLDGLPL